MISTRLKRSTRPFNYRGQTVYIFHDRETGKVVVSADSNFEKTFVVDKVELEAVNNGRAQIKNTNKPLNPSQINSNKAKNDFYKEMVIHIPENCECCGKPLNAFTAFAIKCCTCHILPKAEFKSIATNRDNIMFMGSSLFSICNCHNLWDGRGAKERSEMACYPLAIERFSKFADELSEKDLIRAYKYLNIK